MAGETRAVSDCSEVLSACNASGCGSSFLAPCVANSSLARRGGVWQEQAQAFAAPAAEQRIK